jgi:hypothetical protein
MKRLTVFTLIAVSMLPACTNEALQEKAANQNYSFTARTDAGIKTRTCLGEVLSNETYPLLWEKGDRIIIAPSGKPATSYYETQGQDNDVAEFRFISGLEGNEMPPENTALTALYPADAYKFTDGKHTIHIPENQTYRKNNISSGTMPMIAGATSRELSFRNVCGILRLRLNTLEQDIRLSSIKVAADKGLAGPIATFEGTDVTWNNPDGETGRGITLSCDGVALSPEPEDFYIVLPPGNYSGFKIQLETEGPDKKTYRMDGVLEIERSAITTVNLDLAQFHGGSMEDVTDGDKHHALTELGYGLECEEKSIYVFKEGGSGSTLVKSYVGASYSDGQSSMKSLPWTATFSTDDGATWGSTVPEMFTEFTTHGDGDIAGDLLQYSISPSNIDRVCLVKLKQDESGKEKDLRIAQYTNVLVLTYDTFKADERHNVCYSKDHALLSVIYEDGTEEFVPEKYDNIRVGHVFPEPGRHVVKLRLSNTATTLDNMFSIAYWAAEEYLTTADFSHTDLSGITNMESMFQNCKHLETCVFGEVNTPELKNIKNMFKYCYALRSVDIASLQTDKVTDMSSLFFNCSSLERLDLTGFMTNSVTDMSNMFYSCRKLETLDLSSFDTSNVTNMNSMFCSCNSLNDIDLTSFNTVKAKDMGGIFQICESLESLDLRNFNTSNTENMGGMFARCTKLESIDLSSFNTANCTQMASMFNDCKNLKNLDLRHFSTDKVGSMERMFNNCSSLTELDLSSFHTQAVKSMGYMFENCTSLAALDLTNFSAQSLEMARSMFDNCTSLKNITLNDFNAPNLTNAYMMFYRCEAESISITNFSCADDGYLYGMFYDCSSMKTLTLKNFDASKAGSLEYFLCGCRALEYLDLSEFYTDNVKNMSSMFMNCSSLKHIDLSGMRTSNVTNISMMFSGSAVSELDLSNFDTSNVTQMYSMFEYCKELHTIRMNMTAMNAELHVDRMFSQTQKAGCLYAKDGIVDSRIQEQLPQNWTIEAF